MLPGARLLLTGRNPEKLTAAVEQLRRAGVAADGLAGDITATGAGEQLLSGASRLLGGVDMRKSSRSFGTRTSRAFAGSFSRSCANAA